MTDAQVKGHYFLSRATMLAHNPLIFLKNMTTQLQLTSHHIHKTHVRVDHKHHLSTKTHPVLAKTTITLIAISFTLPPPLDFFLISTSSAYLSVLFLLVFDSFVLLFLVLSLSASSSHCAAQHCTAQHTSTHTVGPSCQCAEFVKTVRRVRFSLLTISLLRQ